MFCVCVYGIAPLALVEGKDSPTRTEDACWSGVNLNIDCDSLTARYSHEKKKKILVEKLAIFGILTCLLELSMKDHLGDYNVSCGLCGGFNKAIVTIKLVTNISLLSRNLAVNVNDNIS